MAQLRGILFCLKICLTVLKPGISIYVAFYSEARLIAGLFVFGNELLNDEDFDAAIFGAAFWRVVVGQRTACAEAFHLHSFGTDTVGF